MFTYNNKIKELIRNNIKDVKDANHYMLYWLLLIVCILLSIPVLASLLSVGYNTILPFYLSLIFIYLIMFIMHGLNKFRNHPEIGLYIGFTFIFLFTIYSSVIISPEYRATVLLGTFCIVPICIIDRYDRIIAFNTFFFILHTVLSFYYKGYRIGIDDTVNCLCYLILSIFLGLVVTLTKLRAYDTKRKFEIEKETDFLTGLKNRRKMFSLLDGLKNDALHRPTGIMMIDIDNFKQYNDQYGHAAGDNMLTMFGTLFKTLEEEYPVQFFRYGGEEFSAFIWDSHEEKLIELAEVIRSRVEQISCREGNTTVSIGLVDCLKYNKVDYDKILSAADLAAYSAKNNGRNSVVFYNPK